MRISVIIPFYGRPDQLGLCLAALEAQTLPRHTFEVIVVDNGSPHDLAPLRRQFPATRWLVENQPGSFAARNHGAKAAAGRLLAFTDSDCVPEPTWLENGAAMLERGEATVIGGKVVYLEPDGRPLNIFERFEEEFFLLHKQKHLVEKLNVSATANLMTSREVFQRIGFFDTELMNFADGDWTKRAVLRGEKLRYADDAVVRHPRRSTAREIASKLRRTAGDRITLLRKMGKNGFQIAGEVLRLSPFDPRTHLAVFKIRNLRLEERARLWVFGEYMSFAAMREKLRVCLGGVAFRG